VADGLNKNNLLSSWHLGDTVKIQSQLWKSESQLLATSQAPWLNEVWLRKRIFAAHSLAEAEESAWGSQKNQKLKATALVWH
jgi:hypothetical protein